MPLYLMPLQFGGVDDVRNIVYVPPIVVELKARYDAMVEDLLVEDKVNGYTASPDYKSASFLQIVAKKDGNPSLQKILPYGREQGYTKLSKYCTQSSICSILGSCRALV